MKVYILLKEISEEPTSILGVFSTEIAAEEAMFLEAPEEEGLFSYAIEEHEIEGGLQQ